MCWSFMLIYLCFAPPPKAQSNCYYQKPTEYETLRDCSNGACASDKFIEPALEKAP